MSETKWTAQGAGVYEDGKLIGCFGDDGDEQEGREQVARARMAAAAPDMAEALRGVLFGCGPNGEAKLAAIIGEDGLSAVKAAYAKARGE